MNEELPEGWTLTTIGAVCLQKVTQKAPEEDFVYVDIRSVDNERKTIVEPSQVALKDAPSRARQALKRGDVLVSLTRPNLNAVAVVPQDLDGSVGSTGFDVLRPFACDTSWLFAFVRSPGFVAGLRGLVQGALYPAVRPRDVRETELPLPPLNEQRRIVAKLEALQARSRRAREALDAVPPLLEKLRQSILAAAFRGDLTKDWRAKHKDVEPAGNLLERIRAERRKKWEEAELAKMKAKGKTPKGDEWKAKYKEPEPVDVKGLPELPEGWCWASLGQLADVGTGATPKRGEATYYEGGTVAWVTSGALNDSVVRHASELVTERALAETNLTVYPPGTLLLAMYGEGKTRGMVAELAINATTNQAIAAICFGHGTVELRDLVRLALTENYHRIREGSSGGVQPNLNLEKVRAIAVPVCPSTEQRVLSRAITATLARIDSLADIVVPANERLSVMDRSLLAKAFRGDLAPQDPNDEPAEVMLARAGGANGAKSNGPQRGKGGEAAHTVKSSRHAP